jgi:hypothetical protein
VGGEARRIINTVLEYGIQGSRLPIHSARNDQPSARSGRRYGSYVRAAALDDRVSHDQTTAVVVPSACPVRCARGRGRSWTSTLLRTRERARVALGGKVHSRMTTSVEGGPQSGFQQLSVVHELEVVDLRARTIRTRHLLHIIAVRRARFFERRFTWTGRGVEKEPQFHSGQSAFGRQTHRLHGPILSEGMRRLFLIDLGRDLEPGEEEQIEFEQTFIDTAGTFQPVLGCRVPDPMAAGEIVLQVTLPARADVTAHRETHFIDQDTCIDRELLVPSIADDTGRHVYRYDIRSSEVGKLYRIAWTISPT